MVVSPSEIAGVATVVVPYPLGHRHDIGTRLHGRMSHLPWWRRSPCHQGRRCQPARRDADCAGQTAAPPNGGDPGGRRMTVKFRVELVWTDGAENAASSIFLTADGRVILQGRAISPQER